jgi:hypothetical protein
VIPATIAVVVIGDNRAAPHLQALSTSTAHVFGIAPPSGTRPGDPLAGDDMASCAKPYSRAALSSGL